MDVKVLNLLLVEDNPGDARLLQETLRDVEALKFDISVTEDLKTAIETLGVEDFDLVLLDLTLPDSKGLQTCMKLRGEFPEIPIIVLTGLDDEEVALRALHQGAQDYLVKGKADTNLLLRSMRYGIERKKIERETLRNLKLQSLETLTECIANDYNNILSKILGNLSLARVSLKPSHKIYENLTLAEKAAFNANDLTKQFLSLTKGGDPIKKATSITRSLKEYARFALGESKIMMQFSIPDDLWQVEVDQTQFGQVVNNIVTDAKQSLPKGGLINISAKNTTIGTDDPMALTPGGKYVKIVFQTKLLGIHKGNASDNPDPLSTGNREGSGIRLANTHSVIEKHGGYIETKADTGSGTITSIYFPASAEVDETKLKKEEKLISGKGNVLVMEDDVLVRDTIIAMIERLGYEVDYAEDADQTVEKYSDSMNNGSCFDIVLIADVIEGEVQCINTIERLKEINSEVVAVLSTGYVHNSSLTEYGKHGFKYVLQKPYNINELGNVLSSSLQK